MTERTSDDAVKAEVIVGGKLKSRKGINVPELQIDCSALTAKDREDAAYLCGMGVDYIALSFAQKREDIEELIELMDAEGVAEKDRPDIIPKIEKPAALRNIDGILELSGGLMVARGDLGVELGLHRVPFAQKFLMRKANDAGKFCITATQMMESMIENANRADARRGLRRRQPVAASSGSSTAPGSSSHTEPISPRRRT